MMKLLCIPLVLFSFFGVGQPNCNIYKVNNDNACYQACLIATEHEFPQGSAASQQKFDEALRLCPALDYAWREKSVPYLKRGDFVTWKKLMDKAVELNPVLYLGIRGWCRYQFVRDYQGAIDDIERLDSLTQFDIGYSVNGDYHLHIARALCYKALGNRKKAMEIFEQHLAQPDYTPMPYDYYHLGVLKYEMGDIPGAILYFEKAISYNDYLADTYFYLGLICKQQGLATKFREHMEQARAHYAKGYHMADPYTHPMDKVYRSEIENELASLNSKK